MQDKIGETFPGIISAVTGFGLFVELADLYVEGLVHVTSLGQDFFKFDPLSHQLKGERTGVCYRLGDSVNIVVIGVNLDDKKIDFELLGQQRKTKARTLAADTLDKPAKKKNRKKPKRKKPKHKGKAEKKVHK
jgi:ribonuclease R